MSAQSLTSLLLLMSSIIVERQYEYDKLVKRETIKSYYDYVIVGAGSAGSVVASRLSEKQSNGVLLLEAGDRETIVSTMPSQSDSLKDTPMDWNYTIVPQKFSCFGLNNRSMKWPRGRALGGTSAINRMAYLRGNPKDFDNWVHESGADGWQWSQVFKYFLRSEKQMDPLLASNGYHATTGPLAVSTPPVVDVMTRQWVIASNTLGYPIIDLNGAHRRGTAITQRNILYGRRQSSAEAYLLTNCWRKNLHILANTLVTKVLFNDKKQAIGVEFTKNGIKQQVYAKKEVILSAGVIGSAQLLLLSGVGPKKHLQDLNIPIIANLPVGHNLHDQPRVYGIQFLTNSTFTNQAITIESLTNYFINGSGPLTQSEYSTTIYQSSYVHQTDWPDVQLGLIPSSPATRRTSGQSTGIRDDIWDVFYKPYTNKTQFSISVILLRPKSRGSLRLKSSNPSDKPLLDPNYFADSQDLYTIAEGMQEAYRIALSPSMAPFDVKPYQTIVPGCESDHNGNFMRPSLDYFRCLARSLTSSAAHMVGTCKMGAISDSSAVVDPKLRVKGISNLRVIDGSIMPSVVSANTHAAIVMIGEYGAEIVLKSSK
ncbi:glucose dehydrogenase [FAD, quinone]-like [Oppia nitens]|uniref:glucose dehydrogenase [FAD, quinone]-like n=1 Tax=Oppia nitens TaxID=1686743 RepID=UPI0023D9D941|nr:glucose dehydrogenase [FAD, quinone]-like [Oppia nitens]